MEASELLFLVDNSVNNLKQKIKYKLREPKIGDKVIIKDESYEKLNISQSHAVKLCRLPYVTVSDVSECILGSAGEYYMSYTIYIKECKKLFNVDYIFSVEDINFIN